MKTWVRKTLSVGVLAAGALLFAPGGAAHADVRQGNGDNNGILNGTQLVAPISVPVNAVGNAIGVAGEAQSSAVGVNRTEGGWAGQFNGDNNGIANGTQAYLPVSVPLNVVGNSLAVLGGASSQGVGVNRVAESGRTESTHTTEGGWGGGWGSGQSNGDNNGIGNGTQIYSPLDIPVNVCGNSLAILGGASSTALCANSIEHGGRSVESAKVTESAWQSNGDNNGILNGTQLYAPVSLPVNLSGNAIALLGGASSHAVSANRVDESAQVNRGGWGGQSNGNNNGLLNGTQIAAPISVPINVCGNALGILGAAQAAAGCGNAIGDDFGGARRHVNDVNWNRAHDWNQGDWNRGDDWNQGDWNQGDDWNLGDHGHKGHGHKGHGHKGHSNQNAGDNGATDPDKGYGGHDNAADAGYTKGNKADDATSSSTKTGGRAATESSPVTGLTDTVGTATSSTPLGGLGLLNTLS